MFPQFEWGAIALNLLFRIPLVCAVLITAAHLTLPLALRPIGMRLLEAMVLQAIR